MLVWTLRKIFCRSYDCSIIMVLRKDSVKLLSCAISPWIYFSDKPKIQISSGKCSGLFRSSWYTISLENSPTYLWELYNIYNILTFIFALLKRVLIIKYLRCIHELIVMEMARWELRNETNDKVSYIVRHGPYFITFCELFLPTISRQPVHKEPRKQSYL